MVYYRHYFVPAGGSDLTPAEWRRLAALVSSDAFNSYVEIGVGRLGTFTEVARLAYERGGGLSCHGIDAFGGLPADGNGENTHEGDVVRWTDAVAHLRQAGLAGTAHLHRGDSAPLLGRLWPELAGPRLIFVDGNHTYDGCRRDFLAFDARAEPGDVLVLHDTCRSQHPDYGRGPRGVLEDYVIGNPAYRVTAVPPEDATYDYVTGDAISIARRVATDSEPGPAAALVAPDRPGDPEWTVLRERWRPAEDGYYESLFALTNGRIGVRATADFEAGGGSPGCYHADLYASAPAVPNQLVNALNPTFRSLAVDGVPVSLDRAAGFRQSVDLRTARLETAATFQDPAGRRTRMRVTTILPAGHPDAVWTRIEVTPLGHDADLTVQVGVDWSPGNRDPGGVPDRVPHLTAVRRRYRPGRTEVRAATGDPANGDTVRELALATAVLADAADRTEVAGSRRQLEALTFRPAARRPAAGGFVVDQVSVLATGERPDRQAAARLAALLREGLARVALRHEREWADRWRHAAEVDGPRELVEGLRYGQFQLFQCVDRYRAVTNVPARGLTSDYHGGHVFFNSELYLVPYFAVTEPAVAAAMLRWRASTLPAARSYAKRTGYRGARFPAEADGTGRDAEPRRFRDPDTGRLVPRPGAGQAVHVSASVLHAVATYLAVTGDRELLPAGCATLVAESARYLADLLRWDAAVDRRGATRVTGFDEFHHHVDHHLATNLLAGWALSWAAEQLARLPDHAGVPATELRRWQQVSQEVYLPPPREGVYPVFEGYFALPDQRVRVDPAGRFPRLEAADQSLVARFQSLPTRLTKQADVVLAMTLLPDRFDDQAVRASLEFYQQRTVHASSLSLAPHAIAAVRAGDRELATAMLRASARYNLDFDRREHYENGVHLAAYAGAWLVLLRGFLRAREPVPEQGQSPEYTLALDPVLPCGVTRLRVPGRWWGCGLVITVEREATVVESALDNPHPVAVVLYGRRRELAPGQRWEVATGQPGGSTT